MLRLSKEFRFEAAHSLPQMHHTHQCHRLHGHSYRFVVWCEGEIDPATGFCAGVDYADISMVAKAYVVDVLDHRNINEFITPYSTAEYLAIWIYRTLKTHLPALCQVDVYETPTSCVSYTEQ